MSVFVLILLLTSVLALGVIIGIILVPVILFLRARRSGWDNSNMTNIVRVLAHLATHPGDFAKMKYDDGSYPFWYLDKDEFSDVVSSRPGIVDRPKGK